MPRPPEAQSTKSGDPVGEPVTDQEIAMLRRGMTVSIQCPSMPVQVFTDIDRVFSTTDTNGQFHATNERVVIYNPTNGLTVLLDSRR